MDVVQYRKANLDRICSCYFRFSEMEMLCKKNLLAEIRNVKFAVPKSNAKFTQIDSFLNLLCLFEVTVWLNV